MNQILSGSNDCFWFGVQKVARICEVRIELTAARFFSMWFTVKLVEGIDYSVYHTSHFADELNIHTTALSYMFDITNLMQCMGIQMADRLEAIVFYVNNKVI